MAQDLVAVAFQQAGKLYYYRPAGLNIAVGEAVVAETPRGLELGKVASTGLEMPLGKEGGSVPDILRKATVEDIQRGYNNRLRAADAYRTALRKIEHHGLPMRLLEAAYTLDASRVVFFFWADGRVDFRNLVRDLASCLRRRIELYQVGARDRAKITGGTGPCGRECCCVSWLREFVPVSIKMTKEQGLALNPTKISGSCGRLMCCLRYEYETYLGLRQELPEVGAAVELPEGRAKVLEVHLLSRTLTVEHPEIGVFQVPAGRAASGDPACASCRLAGCEQTESGEELVSPEGSPPR